ncbi:MAG: sortase [Candidatus Andersenbacteria bacterium]
MPQPELHALVAQTPRRIGKTVARSLGILLVSFILVFASLYTLFTWPLVKIRGTFFVQKLFQNEQTVEAAAQVPTTALVASGSAKDSDNDGYTDQEELAAGYDPYSKQPIKLDTDNDGIKDEVERTFYGTDPYKTDSDSDGFTDLAEIVNGYSPLRPANYAEWITARTTATISIPSIKVKAPVVWSKNPDDIESDLDRGVIKYPGTANPGEGNNTVITGHSSFWSWKDAKYGTIFALIDQLKKGDKVFVAYTGTTYIYEVASTDIKDPYDLSHFAATEDDQLTLVTCYPPGSTAKRYYVLAKLIGEQPIVQDVSQ